MTLTRVQIDGLIADARERLWAKLGNPVAHKAAINALLILRKEALKREAGAVVPTPLLSRYPV